MDEIYALVFIIFLLIYAYAIMEPANSKVCDGGANSITNNCLDSSGATNQYTIPNQVTSDYYDRQYEILRRI